ncbi:hypothetical protein KY366_07825 [Candidatus Woesearchaeota archaeon]|nr:hypothetical protein [Candidatus Woesearchaeota archaeon]
MAERKSAKATKAKKKRWIQVLCPELFRNELIGEIPVTSPTSLIGRTVTVNLMGLTRDIKKQNTSIKFVISQIKGDNAVTDFYGYYLSPTSIRRLVRRGKEKIGFSVVLRTSDNKKIRIMPLMIPYNKVKSSVAVSFKKKAIASLRSYAEKTTFENMIKDLIINKLQRTMKSELKKIYPIRILEVAKLHIEKEKRPLEAGVELKAEELEEEKEIVEEKAEEAKEEAKTEEKTEEKKKVEHKEKKPGKEPKKEDKKQEEVSEAGEEKPKEESPSPEEDKAEEKA